MSTILWSVDSIARSRGSLLAAMSVRYLAMYYQSRDRLQWSSNNCTTSTALIIQYRDKYVHEYTAIIQNTK